MPELVAVVASDCRLAFAPARSRYAAEADPARDTDSARESDRVYYYVLVCIFVY